MYHVMRDTGTCNSKTSVTKTCASQKYTFVSLLNIDITPPRHRHMCVHVRISANHA